MPSPDDKGKFSTDIAQKIIDDALKSVEKRRVEAEGLEVPVEAPNAAPAAAAAPVAAAAVEAPEPTAEPGPAADPRDAEIESLKAGLELSMSRGRDMMQKIKDEHEKMLRAVADLENFKKRAQKEKEEVQKYGSEKMLKDFLPIHDNFDRAFEHAKGPQDFDSLKKGVEMIRKLLEDSLSKHGVKWFSAKGKLFDPNLHEAMTSAETTEVPPNYVVNEVLRGFTLNDRLVRPALVVVAKAPSTPAVPAEAATAPAETPAADADSKGSTS